MTVPVNAPSDSFEAALRYCRTCNTSLMESFFDVPDEPSPDYIWLIGYDSEPRTMTPHFKSCPDYEMVGEPLWGSDASIIDYHDTPTT